MGKIADIWAQVGFKFDSIKLREVSKYIGDLNVSSVVAATSISALGLGIKELVDQSSALTTNLQILSTTTGIDPQYIQKLEHAALVFGSSKQAADQWISSLSSLQQKLTVAQGSQQFFTAAQMLGVDSVGFQKIIGNTEDLDQAVRKILTKTWSPTDRLSQEQFARTKTWLAGLINMPSDLLNAINQKGFNKEMDNFHGLSNKEIQDNISATQEWKRAVDDLNTEFLKLVNPIFPQLTSALKSFTNDGGLKGLIDALSLVAKTLELSMKGWKILLKDMPEWQGREVSKENQKADIAYGQYKQDFLNLFHFKYANEQGQSTPANKTVTINMAPITIHTNDPHEFVKKFDDTFKKYMDLTARQFTLGQT